MKITLAVLFLAGLTIYCKFTAVLSLPPSLIAHAASLERAQTPKSLSADNGKADEDSSASVADVVAENEDDDGGGGEGDGIYGGVDSTVLYKNFKNLWQKNFGIQKRERNAFEDDIAAVVAAVSSPQMLLQPQPQQPMAAIKNNKNALKVVTMPSQRQQQQLQQLPHLQQQTVDNDNNNYLNAKSSAILKSLEIQRPYQLPLVNDAAEYASQKWLSGIAPGPPMLDDIIVSPPHGDTIIDDNRRYDGDEASFDQQQPQHEFSPESGEGDAYDNAKAEVAAAVAIEDSPDSVVWSKFHRPLNYWPIVCRGENENNCLPADYSALIADR